MGQHGGGNHGVLPDFSQQMDWTQAFEISKPRRDSAFIYPSDGLAFSRQARILVARQWRMLSARQPKFCITFYYFGCHRGTRLQRNRGSGKIVRSVLQYTKQTGAPSAARRQIRRGIPAACEGATVTSAQSAQRSPPTRRTRRPQWLGGEARAARRRSRTTAGAPTSSSTTGDAGRAGQELVFRARCMNSPISG